MFRIRMLAALLGLVLAACRGDTPAAPLSTEEVLTFEGALGARHTPADATSTVIAKLRVATRAPAAPPRVPVNVALVVDTSGSMEGQPIADARAASVALVDKLSDGDRLAVIAFGSSTEALLPPTELDDDARALARGKLRAMRAEGTTDMAGGLRAGLDAVAANLDPKGINRVVLLGDGVPNDPSPIHALADEAKTRGVTITALGLGADYDEVLMGAVAQASGGRFRYVDDSSKVAAFFEKEVLRLQGVYARGASVEITPGPGVVVQEVIGQHATPLGAKVRVDLGDLSRDESRELFVRLTVSPRRAGAPVELADAVLRYDAPGVGPAERRLFLGARATASADELAAGRDAALEDAAMVAHAAAATLRAIELARAGQPDEARALLAQVAAELEAAAKRSGSAELKAKAAELRALGTDLPAPSHAAGGAMPPPPKRAGAMPAEPMPSPAAAAPERAKDEAQERRVRAVHDQAMQRLQ